MPKKWRLEPNLSSEKPENRYRKPKDPVERSHLQIVWLINEGKTNCQVLEITGDRGDWMQQLVRRYNVDGPEGVCDQRHRNLSVKESVAHPACSERGSDCSSLIKQLTYRTLT